MDVISTAEVSPGERVAFWREVSSKLWVPYDLRCERQMASRFNAQVGIRTLGSVQATLMTAAVHTVYRTPKLIRAADPDVFKVSCYVRGRGQIAQGDRRAEVGVGDLLLYDTSRPYEAGVAPDVAEGKLLLLRFPRALLPLRDRDLRRLTSVRIPGDRGVGALSAQFLLQLARDLHHLGEPDLTRLSTLTLDVLTTALASALDAQSVLPAHTRQRALMAQIYAFIRQNLGDSRLTPDAIAAAHHISLRYLHKLFQQEGQTVAGWIRSRRLEHCRGDLASPHLADLPINAIAARWGFTSSAHFSQAFRAAYGLSPRQFRDREVISDRRPGLE